MTGTVQGKAAFIMLGRKRGGTKGSEIESHACCSRGRLPSHYGAPDWGSQLLQNFPIIVRRVGALLHQIDAPMMLPSPAPPTGNRFATVTPTDHGAPIFIAAVLTVVFTFLVLFVRITVVKWHRWDIDDIVLVCASAIGIGQWIAIFIAYHNGLGKAIDTVGPRALPHMAKAFFASRILLVVALCLSKGSLLFTIRSIFTAHLEKHWLTSNIDIAVVCAWGAASALALSVNCSPEFVASGPQNVHCPNHVSRLRAVFILEAILESVIVVLPAVFLTHNNMTWRRKLLVVVIFSLRLPTVAFIIAYLVTSTRFVTSGSAGMGIADTAIWQQVLLGYSLMSATIPMLNQFLKEFTTGGMGFGTDTYSTPTGSGQNSKPQPTALQLDDLSKKSTASCPPPSAAAALRRSRSASHVSEDIVPDFSSVASQSSRQQMIR